MSPTVRARLVPGPESPARRCAFVVALAPALAVAVAVAGHASPGTVGVMRVSSLGVLGDAPLAHEHPIWNGVASVNWAGYVESGAAFTSVSATWTVPPAVATPVPQHSSTWIGIDGLGANAPLIQTGTEQDSSGNYYTWWEILPAPETPIARVSPGDQIQASITRTSPGVWVITINDLTSRGTFSLSQAYSGPGVSAEWIEERPAVGCPTCYATLANFGSVTFSNIAASGPNLGFVPLDMVDSVGTRIATTSALSKASFSITYGGATTSSNNPATTTTTPATTTTTPATTTTMPAVTTRPSPVVPPRSGYWMLDSGGRVYAFGDATDAGSPTLAAGMQAVHVEPTPDFNGYWVLDGRGHVYTFGDATYAGGTPPLGPLESVTSMSTTPTGKGYWLFTDTGRAIAYGDAKPMGDLSGIHLNGPILNSVRTASGNGYYMVASDGGIFAFGDATFHGSMGDRPLNGAIVGLVPDTTQGGYWLVGSDAGIFAFGDATFRGSMGGQRLNRPVIGAVAYGAGYLMVGADGGIFNFSDRAFAGSLGANPPSSPMVGVAPLNG